MPFQVFVKFCTPLETAFAPAPCATSLESMLLSFVAISVGKVFEDVVPSLARYYPALEALFNSSSGRRGQRHCCRKLKILWNITEQKRFI
jgi:hypothetical protein